jgi:ABC-type sugar transport system ATPase subunit
LNNVSLDVVRGEVHAIVGENGAGKSTLMQILAGVYTADEGSIEFDGMADVRFADECASQAAGIALVFQERSLFGPLSIADNVFAGRQACNAWGHILTRQLYASTEILLRRVGLEAPPNSTVESLLPAHQQLVEIAKALSLNPKLMIFDEPTASLSLRETQRLFELIRQLKQEGMAILYISHHLQEIFEFADRATVLKDCTYQGTFPIQTLTEESLVGLMVGRELPERVKLVQR